MHKIKKLTKILRCPFYISALRNGVAAGVEHRSILSTLNLNTIIDIGANRGQFSLIARKYFPEAKIIAFEPLSEPANMFRRVFISDRLTLLHELAIGPQECNQIIHISRADDSSSLLPITRLQNKTYPGTEEITTRSVFVKPMDSVLIPDEIKAPAFMKIDVQGYEKQVLEGCKSYLSLFSYIYIECSFIELYDGQALAHEIIAYLANYGFILSGIYNLDQDKNGLPVQGDFLFTQK